MQLIHYLRSIQWGWLLLIPAIFSAIKAYIGLPSTLLDNLPPSVWVTILIISLAFMPYWAFRKINNELKTIKMATPALFVNIPPIVTRYTAHYLHIEIINNPKIKSNETIAKDIVGYLEFYKLGENQPLFKEITGIWADLPEKTMKKYNLNYTQLTESSLRATNQIDIKPNLVPCALSLSIKYKNEDDCYAINYDTFLIYQNKGRRNPNLTLKPGNYIVKLRLLGSNIGEETSFLFDLNNPGSGQELQLSLSNKKLS